MTKTILALIAALFAMAAVPAAAQRHDGYRHGYHGYNHGYHRHHRMMYRHHGHGYHHHHMMRR